MILPQVERTMPPIAVCWDYKAYPEKCAAVFGQDTRKILSKSADLRKSDRVRSEE